jgi:PPM family protein phosphatase
MKVHFITQPGFAREHNEDRLLVRDFGKGTLLAAVSDGMGGHAAGELAAELVVEALNDFEPGMASIEAHLVDLLHSARRKILKALTLNAALEGMGATLSAIFVRSALAHWIHVGDSRLYLQRNDMLVQITEDHTLPGYLLAEGELTKEEARTHQLKHVLLNCIGSEPFHASTGTLEVMEHDLLLLSTDGLHDMLPEEQIESILSSKADLNERLEGLFRAALAAGGSDDMTVVGIELERP